MDRESGRDDRPRRRDDQRAHRSSHHDRERSRSPVRRDHRRDDRHRERSPPPREPSGRGPPGRRDDRERDRDHEDSHRHERPRATNGRRGEERNQPPRYPAADATNGPTKRSVTVNGSHVEMADADGDEEVDAAMKHMMGFSAFKTTKNTKVPGNERNYAVQKVKKTEYRQYMNRVGGFNRALSPSR